MRGQKQSLTTVELTNLRNINLIKKIFQLWETAGRTNRYESIIVFCST